MISMQQIAERVGVSRNTVSKVLNNREGVSELLRQDILRAASELGYTKLPDVKESAAAEVRRNVAVMVTNPEFSQYWMHIINGLAEELNKLNYNLIYNYIYNDRSNSEDYTKMYGMENVSGLIVINVYDETKINAIAKTRIPTVYFDVPVNLTCTDVQGDILLFEGTYSVRKITEHILQQRVQKIGFIGDISYCQTIYDRWLGFQAALQKYNIPIDEKFCLTSGPANHFYNIGEVEQSLALMADLPQAFVCANDVLASRVVSYMEGRGIHVPEDMLVSGFDDSIETLPKGQRLTTVGASIKYLGRRLVRQLFDQIEDPLRPYEKVMIQTFPTLRDTTAGILK